MQGFSLSFYFLSKVPNPGFKNLQVLFPINIHGYGIAAALHVRHLSKASAVRGGDALNRGVGTVHIPLLIHGNIAVKICVLCRNLPVPLNLGGIDTYICT